MKNWIWSISSVFVILMMVAGCGSQKISETQSAGVRMFTEVPKDERLIEFNQALGQISDEASAQAALQMFVDYVDSRVAKESAISARGESNCILSAEQVTQIAKKGVEIQKIAARGEDLLPVGLTLENVAQAMNSVTTEGQAPVSLDLAGEVQQQVREVLPNLANGSGSCVNPMEALVIAYVLHTGDDGRAGVGSIEVRASAEQIQSFVEKILE
jgi:hypothetical protein